MFLKTGFFEQILQFFVVPPKFDQNNFFQKFKKNLVRESLNQQKMTRDIDFRVPGGRESLWTTGEKTGFSRVHCEVPEQPILDFSFRGLQPSLMLKPLHILSFWDSWPSSARKVPILANFEADLKKYTCFFWARTNERCLFGLSSTLYHGLQKLPPEC
jgi:hypothetical protein